YLAAGVGAAACAAAVLLHRWEALLVLAPLTTGPAAGAAAGRRWRLSDLGAGDELRDHEMRRRWIWQPAPKRALGERVYIRSQGEIVHQRPWPAHVAYVPMTADQSGPRLPRGEGQHIFSCGGTGTGKTTSALRVIAARALRDHSAVLAIDQKGDTQAEQTLRNIAARAGVPFILIDPRAQDTDRWQPISGSVAEVVARSVEPIQASEEYYSDMLRLYLGVVAQVLEHAGCWPPSLPFLIDCCQLRRFPHLLKLAADDPELRRRVEEAGDWISSPEGRKAVGGGAVRLQVVMGEAWRPVLAPRVTPGGEHVAVSLANAIRERSTVLWRTYVDDMPKEAAMITVLALADMYAAAQQAAAPWTLMLDEFGGVMHIAANRALAMLQRGRSHHGQVIVVTQSAADPEALTQQAGLLASLTDNFTGFAIHRQNAPEVRDWLAKLLGTTAIWQSTDQTIAHGAAHSGRGSRRRVRLFRVGADVFAQLARGEAIIHSTLGDTPQRTQVLQARFPDAAPERIGNGERHACEIVVHPARTLGEVKPIDKPPAPAKRRTDGQNDTTPQAQRLFEDV
ncbi:MAG: TraM recognition domain-containing protein, partial [Solirubrobacteraceae bacterium]